MKNITRADFITAEKSLQDLESLYGKFLTGKSITVYDEIIFIEKFERFYLMTIIKENKIMLQKPLSYSLFYAWYLMADKLVTIEDKKQFLDAMEVTNNDRKTI